MADRPRRWFEAEWELNQARPYQEWKALLLKKYMPEDYKQNKGFELPQKVLRVGDGVGQFFDEMQNLFQEIDSSMSEDYKVAEIRRAINNLSEYRKVLAVAEADTVQKIRTVLTRLATVDKTDSTIPTVAVDDTEVKFYQRETRRPDSRDKFSNFRGRNTSSYRHRNHSPGNYR